MRHALELGELAAAGLSHREAGVGLRERLNLPPEELPAAFDELCGDGALRGAVVVSTCHRIELYASGRDAAAAGAALRGFLARRAPGSEELAAYRGGGEAVLHLFRVAAGLDSVVVGEHQILGQVKAAYQQALAAGRTDKLLNKLFQAAFATGKQVRARTGISQGITSCGGAAVAMAEKVLPPGGGERRILLIGAGKMAETAARHLLERPDTILTIANRDTARAAELAGRFGGRAVSLEEGMSEIGRMDVIIASTACPHYIVTRDRMAQLASARTREPLVVIDLGMPRNVDPEAGRLPGVHLYNVDDLQAVIADTLAKRKAGIEEAERMAAELAGMFGRRPRPSAGPERRKLEALPARS